MTSVKIDSRWIGLQGPTSRDLMDPERTDGHRHHQGNPDPADGAMGQRPLGRGELDTPSSESRHRREGMKRDRGSGIKSGAKRHGNTGEPNKGCAANI